MQPNTAISTKLKEIVMKRIPQSNGLAMMCGTVLLSTGLLTAGCQLGSLYPPRAGYRRVDRAADMSTMRTTDDRYVTRAELQRMMLALLEGKAGWRSQIAHTGGRGLTRRTTSM